MTNIKPHCQLLQPIRTGPSTKNDIIACQRSDLLLGFMAYPLVQSTITLPWPIPQEKHQTKQITQITINTQETPSSQQNEKLLK
ncbi:hypothetical protein MJO28_016947 [Puccinia striiformis f. sp. tritici]|nr:hypothetical protein MJO28_016947 [Puccinia striiformis f. sp. tritici]